MDSNTAAGDISRMDQSHTMDEIKSKNKGLVTNEEILEKLCFQEFKKQQS